jgi:hypothetical protein
VKQEKPAGGTPVPPQWSADAATPSYPTKADGSPDFKKMTPAQKVAFARGRIRADLERVNGDAPAGGRPGRRV